MDLEDWKENTHITRFEPPGGIRLVQKLPANAVGRDFVVGDLHGCLEQLDELLRVVGFNSAVDRLLSVGDLVDRGPNSMECLQLLGKPWFHSVMGNHEQLMLGCFMPCLYKDLPPDTDSDIGTTFIANGGAWAFNEVGRDRRPSPEFSRLLRMALELPQVLVVGEGSERYNIVHADLAKWVWGKSQDGLSVWKDGELDAMVKPYLSRKDLPGFRWSRVLMEMWRQDPLVDEMAPGLSLTFCGHTVAPLVRSVWSHVCLDTGAFLAHRRSKRQIVGKPGLTLANAQGRSALILRVGAGIEEIPI